MPDWPGHVVGAAYAIHTTCVTTGARVIGVHHHLHAVVEPELAGAALRGGLG